jgi:hypothetical protein
MVVAPLRVTYFHVICMHPVTHGSKWSVWATGANGVAIILGIISHCLLLNFSEAN